MEELKKKVAYFVFTALRRLLNHFNLSKKFSLQSLEQYLFFPFCRGRPQQMHTCECFHVSGMIGKCSLSIEIHFNTLYRSEQPIKSWRGNKSKGTLVLGKRDQFQSSSKILAIPRSFIFLFKNSEIVGFTGLFIRDMPASEGSLHPFF